MEEKSNHLKSILNSIAIVLVVPLFIFASQTSSLAVQPSVAAGHSHTVGLKSDGTVVAVGYNGAGQCNLFDWNLMVKDKNPKAEIIGTWSNGIWYWDEAASKWIQMAHSTPDGDITAGDFTGDGIADVASCWVSGLWYQDGATLDWAKVSDSAPTQVTAGDVTGDGQAEIIGTWSNGIWYWDEAVSKWIQMARSTPDGDITAGDFTGDGKADVVSCWSNGLWYQDGSTLGWTKISDSAPNQVTAGDVTGG
jgi:hypothetical protein